MKRDWDKAVTWRLPKIMIRGDDQESDKEYGRKMKSKVTRNMTGE